MKKFTLFIITAALAVFAFGQQTPKAQWLVNHADQTAMQQKENTVDECAKVQKPSSGIFKGDFANSKVQLKKKTAMQKNIKQLQLRKPLRLPLRSYAATRTANDGSDIISEQPEGAEQIFTRSGMCFYTEDGQTIKNNVQAGLLKMVTAPDGKTVYLQEFVSELAGRKTWVKGTLSSDGKTITVPTGQNVYWLENIGTSLKMVMLNLDTAQGIFVIDNATKEVTLSIDGNTMRLNDTNRNRILGLVYADDDSWAAAGDYESVYTEFSEKLVEKPADVTTKEYLLNAVDFDGYNTTAKVQIGSKGNDVYVQGMFQATAPEAWIKGVKNGNKITFANGQFVGIYEDYYAMYLMGANLDKASGMLYEADFVLTYNDTQDTYTTDMWLLENALKNEIGFIDGYYNISIGNMPDIDINTNIISEQPEGEKKVMTRKGSSYYAFFGQIYDAPQDGFTIDIVYAADGKTIYMKNPITQATSGAWVKGTINGNKINVPLFQSIDYSEENDYYIVTTKLTYTEFDDGTASYIPDFETKEMIFTINPEDETISLEGTDGGKAIYGLIFSDNFQWNGFGDYESHYTPINEEVTVVPDGLKSEEWVMQFHKEGTESFEFVQVAIDGDKIYISELPEVGGNTALVGNITNDKATFASGQYLGVIEEYSAITYFAATTYTIVKEEIPEWGISFDTYSYRYKPELVFNYDANKKSLEPAEDSTCFVLNGGKPEEKIQYIAAYCEPHLSAFVEKASKPADPIIKSFNDYSAQYGYVNLNLNIPSKDVDGNFINPENLAYRILIKQNGGVSPYVFSPDVHERIPENMEIIPYEFTDNYDISAGGSSLFLYATDFEDIGVEVINYTLGQELRSNIVWYYAGTEIAIQTPNTEAKTVKEVTYYNLSGMKMNNPVKGINIVTVTFTDGTTKTIKVIK